MSQKEAFLNEFKGGLFEFSVAFKLAEEFNIAGKFLKSISPHLLQRLNQYDHFIRENDPDLYKQIPLMALEISRKLGIYLPKKVDSIQIVGMEHAHHSFSEADILVNTSTNCIPIGLKLSKKGAYVNTKSGGIKSFLTQYFACFSSCSNDQLDLNEKVDRYFFQMGHRLYAHFDLSFNGRFGQEWREHGKTELPGELEPHLRKIVHEFYFQVMQDLSEILHGYFVKNKDQFLTCLFSLIGLTNPELLQVTCYHHKVSKNDHYGFEGLSIRSLGHWKDQFNEVTWFNYKKDSSSFELGTKNNRIQLRVKPMNKFTSKALKVNCSVKELGEQ